MTDELVHNWNQVNALRSAMAEGEHGLDTVPTLIVNVIEEESWREFVTKMDEHVTHPRFIDFVTAKPLAGLGADKDLVDRIVKGTPAEDVVEKQWKEDGQQGARHDLVSNIHEVQRPAGTTRARALRKLRADAPELHADVLAGRLTAHAAMVKAGFRKRTFSVPAEDPERIAATLRRQLDPNTLAQLAKLLEQP